MKKLLFFLSVLSLFFISCSPQKKLQNLLQKHPEFIVKDTIKFTDTLHTATIFTDTIVERSRNETDTVTLIKEKLKVQLITRHDSIYLSGECQGDTIYINKEIPVEKLSPCPPQKEPTFWDKTKIASVWILVGAVAGLILFRRL